MCRADGGRTKGSGVTGPGSGVRILNAPVSPAFRESVRYGEQNLYTRAKEIVGDRDPRSHEFSVQLRAMDADTSGQGRGRGGLGGWCGALIERGGKGGLVGGGGNDGTTAVTERKRLFAAHGVSVRAVA